MPDAGISLDVNTILAAVSILLFVGLIAYFAFLVRHQEAVEPEEQEKVGVELLEQHYPAGATVEQPTPYWVSPIPASPDPLEIAANLDKKIVFGAAMLFGLFGMIGVYFLVQPGIRAAATEHQLELDVRRGKAVYASLCYDCHGRDGRGGQTPDGKQLPGLPLNKPDLKFETIKEDASKVSDTRRVIEQTISRGRKFTAPRYSMPAWARAEGGPLSPWQVKQLADLIMYGTEEDWADMPQIRQEHEQPVAEQIPEPPVPPSGDEVARTVCTACHAFQQGQNSPNPLAPNLATFGADGPTIAELKQLKASGDPDWLLKWVTDPGAVKAGSPMPPYGASAGGQLDDASLKLVVDHLLKLGTQ